MFADLAAQIRHHSVYADLSRYPSAWAVQEIESVRYPPEMTNIAIEAMAIEIVNLPIKNGDFP